MIEQGLPLSLRDVSKRYETLEALRSTTLEVQAGEFVTLLGPSGSGKSTLLNLVAGYVEPTTGQISLGTRNITHLPARQRNIGMVFQNYALFPHMTVRENVAYGLMVRGHDRQSIARRVADMLTIVQLGDHGDRSVRHLSGGQQQRVALARALAIEPDLVLMDEPLGALDRQLRKSVQVELRRLHEAQRRTTIYVTHDQEEALVLSDRIVVMRDGAVEQVGTASDLYNEPANAFVAGFLGESNLLQGTVRTVSEDVATIEVPGLACTLEAPISHGVAAGCRAQLLIRPEHLHLDSHSGVPAIISECVFLGEISSLKLCLSTGQHLWMRSISTHSYSIGDAVQVGWNTQRLRILSAFQSTTPID